MVVAADFIGPASPERTVVVEKYPSLPLCLVVTLRIILARNVMQKVDLATDLASYLSQDRCELQFAVKELARRMQQLSAKNMQSAQVPGAIPERKSKVFDRLWQTS